VWRAHTSFCLRAPNTIDTATKDDDDAAAAAAAAATTAANTASLTRRRLARAKIASGFPRDVYSRPSVVRAGGGGDRPTTIG